MVATMTAKPYDVMVVLAASHIIHFVSGGSDASTVGEMVKKILIGLDQEGLAIVPKKATPEMIAAAGNLPHSEMIYSAIWQAMMEARP